MAAVERKMRKHKIVLGGKKKKVCYVLIIILIENQGLKFDGRQAARLTQNL